MDSDERPEEPRRRRGRTAMLVAIPLTLLASSAAVYQASSAAFNASTSTDTNSWRAGSVALTNSSSGAAAFNVGQLTPGDGGVKCITVTYNGDLTSDVRLYMTTVSGTLAPYLDFTVEEGTGGNAACVGFTPVTTLSDPSGTLADFEAAYTVFGDGASAWQPTAAGQTRTYRFTWSLQDDNNAMGKSADAKFVWEARDAS